MNVPLKKCVLTLLQWVLFEMRSLIGKPLTENMKSLLRRVVVEGLSDDEIWREVTFRHGPAGYNVIEGLVRRRMLDYFEGNNGLTLRATDEAKKIFS